MRKRTKIVRTSDRCDKACALARNPLNYPVSASNNDAQGVLGRAPASKIGVRRAKVERKTLEGHQKIDRQPPEERQSAPKSEKAGRGVPRPRCPSLKSFDRIEREREIHMTDTNHNKLVLFDLDWHKSAQIDTN